MAPTNPAGISFRILEIIALLLPLVAIFGQLALRMALQDDPRINIEGGETITNGIQIALTALFIGGLLVTGDLALRSSSLVSQAAAIALFYAFVGIWIAALSTIKEMESAFADSAGVDWPPVNAEQQRLTRWEREDTTTEVETETDGNS